MFLLGRNLRGFASAFIHSGRKARSMPAFPFLEVISPQPLSEMMETSFLQ